MGHLYHGYVSHNQRVRLWKAGFQSHLSWNARDQGPQGPLTVPWIRVAYPAW